MKICKWCHEPFQLADGRYKYCSDECAEESHRAQCRERAKRHYHANLEQERERCRRYHWENREKKNTASLAYYYKRKELTA